MTEIPDLSVIVCTRNRPHDLVDCLQALSRLERVVEVIVVDSASDPPCRDFVEGFRDRLDPLIYAYEPGPGLSRARNRGVELASHELVAFIDDDALVTPNWADEMIAAFDRPATGCVGGRCDPLFSTQRPGWLSDRTLTAAGITRFGDRMRRARSAVDYPFGANMAMRRVVLDAVGPFDTRLGNGGSGAVAGDDTEMCARISAAGWEVWLSPSVVVRHKVDPSRCVSRYYWRRSWWNGTGRARNFASPALSLRLAVAIPVYLALYPLTRDRYFLYRVAECLAYFNVFLPAPIRRRGEVQYTGR